MILSRRRTRSDRERELTINLHQMAPDKLAALDPRDLARTTGLDAKVVMRVLNGVRARESLR